MDFRRGRLGVGGRDGYAPLSLNGAAFSSCLRWLFAVFKFLIDLNALEALARKLFDFFNLLSPMSPSSGRKLSFLFTFTTSTTSVSSNIFLNANSFLVNGGGLSLARPSLLRGITTVSCDSLHEERWNAGARLSVCWWKLSATSRASMSGLIDNACLLSEAAS